MTTHRPPTSLPRALAGALAITLLLGPGACSDPGSGGGLPVTGGDTAASPDTAAASDTAASDTAADATAPDAVATDSSGTPDTGPPPSCDACEAPAVCIEGSCVLPEPGGCTAGVTGLCYGDGAIMTCDATGTAFVPAPCPANQACLDNACKPVICVPGQFICEGLTAKKACNADGTGFEEAVVCPEQQFCNGGKCGSSCAIDPKFGSYVGCAYWTVDLPNYPDPTLNPTPEDLPYAVVISNPGELDAEITWEAPPGWTVDDGGDPLVKGGASRAFQLPVMNVQETGISHSGIRFESTRPVLVHQFNPWDNQFSNDASLLLPETFLGSDYVVLSWPTSPLDLIALPIPGLEPPASQSGYFTVLAPYDDTQVTVQVTARVKAGDGVTEMPPGGVQVFTLDRGEVLNLQADPETLFSKKDLTGSTVSATKPVAVFSGHEEAVVTWSGGGEDSCCADHLEEQLLPISVLGLRYLAVKSSPRGDEADIWRIQAAEAGVQVTTDPPQPGANGVTLAKKGDWLEIEATGSFEITGSGKLQVGQYLVSQQQTLDWTGDPSLILAVPLERFRDFYVLSVPPDYTSNFVTVVKPAGATVSTGTGPIPEAAFTPFGSGAYAFAYLPLDAGIHKLAGDAPFGLSAYGYNNAVSYGYPGGLGAPGE